MDEARNRDERVADSHERAEIDAAIGAMANDTAYQTEARMIAAEFSRADWEASQLGEDEWVGAVTDEASRCHFHYYRADCP